ncbi:MAG: nucleotide exchange factor GrpE [Candidatus Latescibacterota bacterium]
MMKKSDKKHHDASRESGPAVDTQPVPESDMTGSGEGAPEGVALGTDASGQAVENETRERQEGTPEEVRKLEERLAAVNEKHIRLLAEYDNYRKRTSREMEAIANIASEKLIQQFLPILDNLDRATDHKNDKTTFEDYVKGIALIEEQLLRVLAQAGLRRMEVIGERFDPAVHSAILQAESKEHESGIIIAEVEKGYTLNDKIIRHPKVVVSK